MLLFAGAFAVSYLVMPGSFARSGVLLATASLVYSGFINYQSTCLILNECRKHNLRSYYEYYTHVLGSKLGNVVFFVFFLVAFIVTVGTLVSLNELLGDFSRIFTDLPLVTTPANCFWVFVVSALTTPFVYQSSDESMSLITVLTGLAILSSLSIVVYTFVQRYEDPQTTPVKYFDLGGCVFSFDVSYFSFIVQLNVFDLFSMFKGSLATRFNKIKRISFITNFFIFVPYFVVGNTITSTIILLWMY